MSSYPVNTLLPAEAICTENFIGVCKFVDMSYVQSEYIHYWCEWVNLSDFGMVQRGYCTQKATTNVILPIVWQFSNSRVNAKLTRCEHDSTFC
jgi:hypothetical protein